MRSLGDIATDFSILLTVLDIVTDVTLAIDYCVTDNPWWYGLTWGFIAIPLITGPCFLCACYIDIDDDSKKEKSLLWKAWKSIEICFESGPQLLLQLYILALTDVSPTATSGNFILKI